MFRDNKDFIEKGLKIGIHLIDKISTWNDSSKYKYGNGVKHKCKDYREDLHAHLAFTTDCRFYQLEYQPTLDKTLYGLKKIGMMGILEKKLEKQWKWNPVDIQVDERFVQEDEKSKDDDQFILE